MTVALTKDEQFFYDHAGWSYDPKTETSEGGHRRCATELAAAEAWGEQMGVEFSWVPDDDDAADGDDTPIVREGCIAKLMISPGTVDDVTTSLWSIGDATPEYRRVIEAELASELADTLQTFFKRLQLM